MWSAIKALKTLSLLAFCPPPPLLKTNKIVAPIPPICVAKESKRYDYKTLFNIHKYNLDPDHLQRSSPGKIEQEFGL